MREGGDRFRLPLEALAEFGALRQVRGKNLDGDGPLQARVPSPIHLPHPARPERREDLVGAEAGPTGESGHPP